MLRKEFYRGKDAEINAAWQNHKDTLCNFFEKILFLENFIFNIFEQIIRTKGISLEITGIFRNFAEDVFNSKSATKSFSFINTRNVD